VGRRSRPYLHFHSPSHARRSQRPANELLADRLASGCRCAAGIPPAPPSSCVRRAVAAGCSHSTTRAPYRHRWALKRGSSRRSTSSRRSVAPVRVAGPPRPLRAGAWQGSSRHLLLLGGGQGGLQRCTQKSNQAPPPQPNRVRVPTNTSGPVAGAYRPCSCRCVACGVGQVAPSSS